MPRRSNRKSFRRSSPRNRSRSPARRSPAKRRFSRRHGLYGNNDISFDFLQDPTQTITEPNLELIKTNPYKLEQFLRTIGTQILAQYDGTDLMFELIKYIVVVNNKIRTQITNYVKTRSPSFEIWLNKQNNQKDILQSHSFLLQHISQSYIIGMIEKHIEKENDLTNEFLAKCFHNLYNRARGQDLTDIEDILAEIEFKGAEWNLKKVTALLGFDELKTALKWELVE